MAIPISTLVDPGYLCDHWGRWDSYSGLRRCAKKCRPCSVLRDWFRAQFSARLEEQIKDSEQLDDRICAQFPSDQKLPSQATFQLRSLDTEISPEWESVNVLKNRFLAAVIEACSGDVSMECIIILRKGNPLFISGILLNRPLLSYVTKIREDQNPKHLANIRCRKF
jgi:hypothetical protein